MDKGLALMVEKNKSKKIKEKKLSSTKTRNEFKSKNDVGSLDATKGGDLMLQFHLSFWLQIDINNSNIGT